MCSQSEGDSEGGGDVLNKAAWFGCPAYSCVCKRYTKWQSLYRSRPRLSHFVLCTQEADGEGGGDVWNKAAWFGWQFMSVRDAKSWMPETIKGLSTYIPMAHRFVGIARQVCESIFTYRNQNNV